MAMLVLILAVSHRPGTCSACAKAAGVVALRKLVVAYLEREPASGADGPSDQYPSVVGKVSPRWFKAAEGLDERGKGDLRSDEGNPTHLARDRGERQHRCEQKIAIDRAESMAQRA
jgi:hypothetical protein